MNTLVLIFLRKFCVVVVMISYVESRGLTDIYMRRNCSFSILLAIAHHQSYYETSSRNRPASFAVSSRT